MVFYYKAASSKLVSPKGLQPLSPLVDRRATNQTYLLFLPFLILLIFSLRVWRQPHSEQLLSSEPSSFSGRFPPDPDPNAGAAIIVITPTHKRPERLADLTRFSQTLSHVRNLHWIVIEDAKATVPAVERILKRTGLPYVYFQAISDRGLPMLGWTQRNRALAFIRSSYARYKGEAVVYFADEENVYDIRLFNNYIRNVKRLGFWAVGLAGAALVEAPRVENDTIVAWDTWFAPNRAFATDYAGFALNLKEVLRASNASFKAECAKHAPETCFLQQFGIKKIRHRRPTKVRHKASGFSARSVDELDLKMGRDEGRAEPFGYDDEPKEILVWHLKTDNIGTEGERHGYVIE